MSSRKLPHNSSTRSYGITGGIGSGKSFICSILESHGFPVFYCDPIAKAIIRNDLEVRRELAALVGQDVYTDNGLNKPVLAAYLCKGPAYAKQVDEIVHPRVAQAFLKWKESANAPVVFMECALLFESGFDLLVDRTIQVTVPEHVRIRRVMQRDCISEEKAKAWMNLQMPEEEKVQRANYQIINDGEAPILPQLESILKEEQTARKEV